MCLCMSVFWDLTGDMLVNTQGTEPIWNDKASLESFFWLNSGPNPSCIKLYCKQNATFPLVWLSTSESVEFGEQIFFTEFCRITTATQSAIIQPFLLSHSFKSDSALCTSALAGARSFASGLYFTLNMMLPSAHMCHSVLETKVLQKYLSALSVKFGKFRVKFLFFQNSRFFLSLEL